MASENSIDAFWPWLFRGSRKGPPGILNVVNRYLVAHIAVAMLLTVFVKSEPFAFAQRALFPACSILVGLSMAWTTRASTILQVKDLRDKLFTDTRPPEDYIYGFQLAILTVIVMVIYVAIMAGGGLRLTVFGEALDVFISAFWMYFLLSLSLRECWGVVNFSNMLSMVEYLRSK